MALLANKDWDRHVADAEEVARGGGFRALRDQILERAEPSGRSTVVDVGSGTGLLTLAFAERCDRVWAVDISAGMAGYLRAKAASAGLENVEPVVASAVSLPLVDCSADLVVSNYCFHHLRNADKVRALEETQRVLRPGGTLVFGDMMFSPGLRDTRDRQVISAKVRALLRKGPAGAWRLLRTPFASPAPTGRSRFAPSGGGRPSRKPAPAATGTDLCGWRPPRAGLQASPAGGFC